MDNKLDYLIDIIGFFDYESLNYINKMSSFVIKNNRYFKENIKLWFNKSFLNFDRNYYHITFWETSNITCMYAVFQDKHYFNDILLWNTSKVKNMALMFCNATNYNKELNFWIVSNVREMYSMFSGAKKFNQELNLWEIKKLENAYSMFSHTNDFNKPLNNWDVSNIIKMNYMFFEAKSFNQPLDNWNVENLESMTFMFNTAINFNQSLNNWNIRNVGKMTGIFSNSRLEKEGNIPNWYIIRVINKK